MREDTSQRALAISPDNRSLVTATDILFIWDLKELSESGKIKKIQQWSGHADVIRAADFSPDGRLLATAAADHNIIIWDVASGKNLMTLYDQKSFIFDIKFSPDGTQLVSTTFDGILTIYALNPDELLNLAYNRLTRWFTPEQCRQYLGSETCPPAPWSMVGQDSPFPG